MFGFSGSSLTLLLIGGAVLLVGSQSMRMLRHDVGGNFKLIAMTALSVLGLSQYSGWFSDSDTGVKSSQAAQMAQRITLELPALEGRPKVAVAPFQRDQQEQLSMLLRDWLGRRNVQIVQPTLPRQALDLVMGREAADPAVELSRAMDQGDCQYILCGEVLEWVTFPSQAARLRVRAQLFDVESGKPIFDKTFTIPEPSTLRPEAESLPQAVDQVAGHVVEWTSQPFVMGLIAWLLTVLLSPWLFASWVSSVLSRDSNAGNAVMMVVFALLSAAAAWLCWGRMLDPDSSWMVLLIAVLVSVPYFGFVCGRLEEARA